MPFFVLARDRWEWNKWLSAIAEVLVRKICPLILILLRNIREKNNFLFASRHPPSTAYVNHFDINNINEWTRDIIENNWRRISCISQWEIDSQLKRKNPIAMNLSAVFCSAVKDNLKTPETSPFQRYCEILFNTIARTHVSLATDQDVFPTVIFRRRQATTGNKSAFKKKTLENKHSSSALPDLIGPPGLLIRWSSCLVYKQTKSEVGNTYFKTYWSGNFGHFGLK